MLSNLVIDMAVNINFKEIGNENIWMKAEW